MADALKVDPSTIYRWEAGESTPRPGLRPRLARLLQVSVDQVDELLEARPRVIVTSPQVIHPSRPDTTGSGRGTGATALASFRATDSKVGGGHLYASIVDYLRDTVGPSLVGASANGVEPLSFDAAASLTEMAGWMAHEAGLNDQAEAHFARANDLVRIGGDQQLHSHVLASMSHLALHQRRADRSIRLAQQGRAVLERGPSNPGLMAHLLGIEARAHAQLGDARTARGLLRVAGESAGKSPGGEQSDWVAPFDEASLASEVLRCMQDLHDLSEARRQAEQILLLRPPSRARSRTLGQIGLAKVCVAQRRLDEAIANTDELLVLAHSVTSAVVTCELAELAQMLKNHRNDAGVGELLEHLLLVIDQRQWLDHRQNATTISTTPADRSGA
jgi:hypothetical protein